MEEEVTLISSKTRNEKIVDFFNKNKKPLILVILLLIVSIISFFSFKIFKENQLEHLSEKYNSAIIEFQDDNSKEIILSMKEIIYNKNETYSPLALYFLVDKNLIKNKDEMNELFDVVIFKTNLEKEIKNLNIYKKALYNANTSNEKELLDILKPLINSESIWKSHGLYLMGEFFYSKKELEKSKEFFFKIIETENVNQDILSEARMRLNRDLSD